MGEPGVSRILVLGHGWRMWNERHIPRCAPMTLQEWNEVVQDAPRDSLTFLDFCREQEPDICENIGNDWSRHIYEPNSYDYVIDSVSHLASGFRKSKYYWEGVKHSLKDDGLYIGWNDKQDALRGSTVKIYTKDIDSHVLNVYGGLRIPKKNYETFY
jgi:hypothetical protein